jgi:hypothetical protein
VFVQEVSPAWAPILDKLPAYPYRKIAPRRDSFGIALLSKHPLDDVTVVVEGEFDIPAITATMMWESTKVALRAVPPHPPIEAPADVPPEQDAGAHAVALAASGQPAIMVGDVNATLGLRFGCPGAGAGAGAGDGPSANLVGACCGAAEAPLAGFCEKPTAER